jgi:hypothetical protein
LIPSYHKPAQNFSQHPLFLGLSCGRHGFQQVQADEQQGCAEAKNKA